MEDNNNPTRAVQRSRRIRRVKVASWNVRSAMSSGEAVSMMLDAEAMFPDVLAMQEMRRTVMPEEEYNCGDWELHAPEETIWKNSTGATQGGLGFLVRKKGILRPRSVEACGTHILTGRFSVEKGDQTLLLINVHTPNMGHAYERRQQFFSELAEAIGRKKSADSIILLGDFNAEMFLEGEDDAVMGKFGGSREGEIDARNNASMWREFLELHGLKDALSRNQHRVSRRWTHRGAWEGRRFRTIDHIMFRGVNEVRTRVWGSALHRNSDHRPVVMDWEAKFLGYVDKKADKAPMIRRALRCHEAVHHVDRALQEMEDTSDFQKVVEKCCQIALERRNVEVDRKKPWISDATLDMIRHRATIEDPVRYKVEDKRVKKAAKNDYRIWIHGKLDDVERAHACGNTHQVHRSIKEIAGKGGARNDVVLTDDQKHFEQFFQKLFSKLDEEKTKDKFKNSEAWKVCQEDLRNAPDSDWSATAEVPSMTEFTSAVQSCKSGKSCAGFIPIELVKRSKRFAEALYHNVVCPFWRGEEISWDWKTAEVKLLHKKGSRKLAKNFRPIALLQCTESIISMIVYKRLIPEAPKSMLGKQFGFLPGKSGRVPVRMLLQDIEECEADSNKKGVVVYVDFQKAFDSLNHNKLLASLRRMGCQPDLSDVIARLYKNSKAKLKFGKGEFSKELHQQRGIRQGSTLSPLLFIISLDWAMKCCEEAMRRKGWAPEDWRWDAYADDIAAKARCIEAAQDGLYQLEAACAFIGLGLASDKTEVQPINITRQLVSRKDATRETFTTDSREGHGREGIMIDINGAVDVLSKQELTRVFRIPNAQSHATHLLRFDSEPVLNPVGTGRRTQSRAEKLNEMPKQEWVPVKMKAKSGWCTFYRQNSSFTEQILRLGFVRYIDAKKNVHVCDKCQHLLADGIQLKAHKRSKWCLRNMTKKQMIKRRNTRQVEGKNRCLTQERHETVVIMDTAGAVLPCCGSFKYLGTMISPKRGMGPELQRRTRLARVTLHELSRIWKSRNVGRRAKRRIFETLVMSVLLYNTETWALSPQESSFLSSNYVAMAKYAMDNVRRVQRKQYKESSLAALQRFGLPPVQKIVALRKAIWIGHVIRGDDLRVKSFFEEGRVANRKWWQVCREELVRCGTDIEEVIANANNPLEIRKLFN